MGNVIRKLDNRITKRRIKRATGIKMRNILEQFLTFAEGMTTKDFIKSKKPRPNRRQVVYMNNSELGALNKDRLIWNPVDLNVSIRQECDPTVPDERFDKLDLLTLRNIAINLRDKKPKNYDCSDVLAYVAMCRFLNAANLAKWGSMIKDESQIGDGADVGQDVEED